MDSHRNFNEEVEDLSERFLLHLRGLGPMPDLGHLDAGQRETVRERFELLDALADRPAGPPARDQDPVATRLGLTGAEGSEGPGAEDEATMSDPVEAALGELDLMFGDQVALLRNSPWMDEWDSMDLAPVAQCNVLGIPMAIFKCDELVSDNEPVEVGHFLRRYPDISAVTVVTRDASRAVVLNDASTHRAIDPAKGWVPAGAYVTPGPFNLELHRFLDSRLPRWDPVDGLEHFGDVTDVLTDAATATAEALEAALRMNPRLPHKQAGQAGLRDIRIEDLTALVAGTQSGNIEPAELVDMVLALGEAAT